MTSRTPAETDPPYRAAWLEMIERCSNIKKENFNLRKQVEASDKRNLETIIELGLMETQRNQLRDQVETLKGSLAKCRTSYCGYAITKDEQYPKVLEDFWREIQRIDGVARASLSSTQQLSKHNEFNPEREYPGTYGAISPQDREAGK